MNTAELGRYKAIERKNKERWLKINPYLTDESGIYILTRVDENKIKYAYIGQAKRILTRLAQHLANYDWIDLSIKKHGLLDIDHPHGWFVQQTKFPIAELDAAEQQCIKMYADMGYQLRNKTVGGQGKGKVGLDNNKPSKGYYDGKKQGRSDVIKALNKTLKYLEIKPKDDSKLSQRMLAKFWETIGEVDNGKSEDTER